MMQRCPFLLFILSFFVLSCAPKRSEILLNTDATPPDVLLKMVEDRGAKISSLVGRGTVSFESPEIAGTAAFESNMKKPDSLLVTLEGPFGIDVGTFFLCKEKYLMYNSLENTVTTGNPNSSSIRSVIPFDLTYEQILNAFAGLFTIPYSEKELKHYAIDDDMFFLVYTCGAKTCTYWIDPKYLLITRFEQRDASDNLIVEAKAYAFTQQDDVAAARRIQIKFPQQSRQLSIAYRSIRLNVTDTDFQFTIPPNARVISKP
jgi:outer membrane lipoprotein-sorting protein